MRMGTSVDFRPSWQDRSGIWPRKILPPARSSGRGGRCIFRRAPAPMDPSFRQTGRCSKAELAGAGNCSMLSKDSLSGAMDVLFPGACIFGPGAAIAQPCGEPDWRCNRESQLYGELRSQIQRLTVMYELSKELTSTLSIDQIFQVVGEHLHHVVPFNHFMIDFVDAVVENLSPAFHVDSVDGALVFIPVVPQSVPLDAADPAGRSPSFSGKRSVLGQPAADAVPMLSRKPLSDSSRSRRSHRCSTPTPILPSWKASPTFWRLPSKRETLRRDASEIPGD